MPLAAPVITATFAFELVHAVLTFILSICLRGLGDASAVELPYLVRWRATGLLRGKQRLYTLSRLLQTSAMFVFTPSCNGAGEPKLGVYLYWLSLTYLL
jgi:hypothetical protein